MVFLFYVIREKPSCLGSLDRKLGFFPICIYLVMLVRNLAGNLLGDLFILEDSKSSILGVFGVRLPLDGITEKSWESPYTVITWPHFVHSWPQHRG